MIASTTLERLAKYALAVAALMLLIAHLSADELGTDSGNHFLWLRSFPQLVLSGDLRPTWLPEGFKGLGSPTFYFYPPLTYWIATLIYPLYEPLSGVRAFLLVSLVASTIAFFSARVYLRSIGTQSPLLFWAALLYAVAPFRVYEIFTRSGLSAHVAFAFIPLVFAGVEGLLKQEKRAASFAIVVGGLAAIALSNIPSLLITAAALAIYLAIPLWRREGGIVQIGLACICGAGLAAFYLLPIPHLVQYVQRSKLEVTPDMRSDVVKAIQDLIHGIGITENTHSVLNILTALTLITLIVAYRSRIQSAVRPLRLILILSSLGIVMQLFLLSGPLWSTEMMKTVIQHPHRWSVLIVFAVAIAYATLRSDAYRRWVLYVVVLWGAASAGFSTLAGFHIRVHERGEYLARTEPPEYATIYAPAEKQEVLKLIDEHVNDPQILALRSVQEGEYVKVIGQGSGSRVFEAAADKPIQVRFHRWYWPYWQLVNSKGTVVATRPDSLGLAIAMLPAGRDTYSFRLLPTREETYGKWISVAALAFVGAYCYYLTRRNATRHQ